MSSIERENMLDTLSFGEVHQAGVGQIEALVVVFHQDLSDTLNIGGRELKDLLASFLNAGEHCRNAFKT